MGTREAELQAETAVIKKTVCLLAKHAHGVFQALQGQREHAVADQLLNDADALAVLPHAQGFGVDPCKLGVGVG